MPQKGQGVILGCWMRSLALLGLLGAVGCGLDLGGSSQGGEATPGGEAMAEDASSLQEAAARVDGGADATATDASGADAAANDATSGAIDSGGFGGPDGAADLFAPASDGAVDGPAGDGPSADGPAGVTPDAPSTSACLNAIPNGWSLVLYDLGTDACPSNFTAHDVLGATTIDPAACSCGCSVAQDGNCAQGTLTVHPSGGGNSACDLDAGWSKDLDGSGCTPLGVTLFVSGPHSDLSTPLVARGGNCADTIQADPTKLGASGARYCDVPSASADSVCNGSVSSGFAACIMAGGESACPSGSPFVHSYVVEDSASLQCSSCAGCTVMTTCSNAVLTGFSDTACSNLVGSVGIDGGCNPANLNVSPAPLVAVEYTASAASLCTPGTSTPSAQLVNPRTVCCR